MRRPADLGCFIHIKGYMQVEEDIWVLACSLPNRNVDQNGTLSNQSDNGPEAFAAGNTVEWKTE